MAGSSRLQTRETANLIPSDHGATDRRLPAGDPPAGTTNQCPLFLEGWLEFNRARWRVRPYRFRYSPSDSNASALESVLYLNARGRIVLPKLNPYLPVAFQPTPTRSPIRLCRQWLEIAQTLVDEMGERQLGATVTLPPEVTDIRPWIWAGFQVGVHYTYYNDLPIDAKRVDPAVRKKCQQARSLGYTCERSSQLTHVLACLRETEKHQRFSYGLTERDLKRLTRWLGEDCFRMYLCYSPEGRPASARLVLYCPGGRAMDWVCGTAAQHIRSGATQLLIWSVLEDLHSAGARGFDFGGANIRNVAAAKMIWGGQLVPFYSLQAEYNLRTLAKWLYGWVRYHRTGTGPRGGPVPVDMRSPGGGSVGLQQPCTPEDLGD
jgi:GNAT acetyltransferase-like protein